MILLAIGAGLGIGIAIGVIFSRRFLSDHFRALSADSLKASQDSLLQVAKLSMEKMHSDSKGDLALRQQAIENFLSPIKESLTKVDQKIVDLEKARVGAYEAITTQVRSLLETQTQLKSETANLVKALRAPQVRGRWGEIQLKRVVELAGMVSHCDFFEQVSTEVDGGRLRPDLIVRLPGEKSVVVDAKAPLSAYLESLETENEVTKREKLKQHAMQIRSHVTQLSRKAYWDQFTPAPEFVVLFLPGEVFLSAALEQDPSLLEVGVEQKVILATPMTLISLLRAVAYGWRQENVAKNAAQVSELGRELHKRLRDLTENFSKVGRGLASAVEGYNKTIGTFEKRVLVTARKFEELGTVSSSESLPEIEPVEQATRSELEQ